MLRETKILGHIFSRKIKPDNIVLYTQGTQSFYLKLHKGTNQSVAQFADSTPKNAATVCKIFDAGSNMID